MKTAFIRIHFSNNTEQGVIEYKENDILAKCEELTERYSGLKYAYIIHDKDTYNEQDEKQDPAHKAGTLKAGHFHILVKMSGKNTIRFKYLKEIFPYGSIEPARSVNASMQYLLHLNNPDKTQYDRDNIKTNMSDTQLDEYLSTTDSERPHNHKMIDNLLARIGTGEIREYNRFDYIDDITLARNANLFKTAFKNRSEKVMRNPNRNIEVIFINGNAGCGKTTYAKMLAKNYGDGSYYISSSSNDSMQDYAGQDVLILDDLRDNAFDFADFLKLLDNHTASSIKSRYFNKTFLGKCIIITSTKEMTDWYMNSNENRNQFYRRVSAYIKMDEKTINVYEVKYNDHLNCYYNDFAYKMPNIVSELYKQENEAKKDPLRSIINISRTMLDNLEVSENFRNEFNNALNNASEKVEAL